MIPQNYTSKPRIGWLKKILIGNKIANWIEDASLLIDKSVKHLDESKSMLTRMSTMMKEMSSSLGEAIELAENLNAEVQIEVEAKNRAIRESTKTKSDLIEVTADSNMMFTLLNAWLIAKDPDENGLKERTRKFLEVTHKRYHNPKMDRQLEKDLLNPQAATSNTSPTSHNYQLHPEADPVESTP